MQVITNESTEMYLETLYLLQRSHGHAHVADIAKKLDITMPSVSKAMRKLKDLGYINMETYGPVTLTKKGERFSKRINRKHNLISDFLQKALNVSREEAEENACRMEHVITDDLMDSIQEYLEEEKV
jgi:DtxR family transcriptional regulator, Mn-dependent transcriptional regulator